MRFIHIFKRDFINITLNPILLFANTLLPLILVLVLGYLTNGNYDYYAITVLIYSALNVSTTAANSFMEKGIKLSNMRIMYAPVNKAYIFLSKILASFTFTSICFFIYSQICIWFLGIEFGGKNYILILILIFMFNLLTSALGIFFCCIFRSEEMANTILSLVNNIFSIFGGIFFSIEGFGSTAQKISNISPVKWIAKAAFQIAYDGNLQMFFPIIIIFTFAIIVLTLLCKFTFKMEDYL